MSKEFDWDKFNAELQKSNNICSGARQDIERAIAKGKGRTTSMERGQVWLEAGAPRLLVVDADGVERVVWIESAFAGSYGKTYSAPGWENFRRDFNPTFAAQTLAEYFEGKK
jgi:hypothetical protein